MLLKKCSPDSLTLLCCHFSVQIFVISTSSGSSTLILNEKILLSIVVMKWFVKFKVSANNVKLMAGPPGSGKGTQSPIIKDEYCLCHLATGDMLRAAVAAKTPLGIKAKEAMNNVSGSQFWGWVTNFVMLFQVFFSFGEWCPFWVIFTGWTCVGWLSCWYNWWSNEETFMSKRLHSWWFPKDSGSSRKGCPTLWNICIVTSHLISVLTFNCGVMQLDEMLQKQGSKIDKVLNFAIDDAILEERITGRWIHPSSGRSYHTKFQPPKVPGVDDVSLLSCH